MTEVSPVAEDGGTPRGLASRRSKCRRGRPKIMGHRIGCSCGVARPGVEKDVGGHSTPATDEPRRSFFFVGGFTDDNTAVAAAYSILEY